MVQVRWVPSIFTLISMRACKRTLQTGQQIKTELLAKVSNQQLIKFKLVGQLAIEYPLTNAAPDPPKRRKRARSRLLLRVPFQTKGVRWLFHPSTVCSNQSMTSCAFLRC